MAESAVAVNFPAPPAYENRVSTTGPTTGQDTTDKTLSEEQKATLAAGADIGAQEIAATQQKRDLADKTARTEQQNVELQQFVGEARENMLTGPEAKAAKGYVDWARNHVREESDRYAKAPAPALFADRQGWSSVRLAVGMALAGLGDGMMAAAAIRAGHAPTNRNTVGQIIETDLNRQRAAIEKLKDNVVIARTGLTEANEARQALLADIDLKGKRMYQQAELLMRGRLAGLKLDQAAIDQTKEILDIKQRINDKEMDVVKGHSRTVQNRWDSAKTTTENINRIPGTGGAGGGVEAAKGSVNYNLFKEHGQWLRDNLPNLSEKDRKDVGEIFKSAQFYDKNTSVTALMATLGIDRERGMSSAAKEFIARAREAADAKGRIKSGGAINLGEEQRFISGVTPEVSDGAKDISMRQALIDTDIRVMSPLDKGATPPGAGGTTTAAPAVAQQAPSQTLDDKIAAAKEVLNDKSAPTKKRDAARAFLLKNRKRN